MGLEQWVAAVNGVKVMYFGNFLLCFFVDVNDGKE